MAHQPLRLHTGQKLGHYELLVPVAGGGVGQVWAARLRGARGFHKLVAIKTLPRGDASAEQELLSEARLAASILHSNVAQTLELAEHEGTLYLVMEWVDGEPLSAIIECAERAGGVPLLVAVNWIAQVLRGLQAAHELKDDSGARQCVVHREVAPQNILVSYSGTAKLVDFGIAKPADSVGRPSEPGYLSPEQISDGTVDSRSDLFAVGVLLYRLTTGCAPFTGQNAGEISAAILGEEPLIRPSQLKPNYSRTLEAVVMKALEKDPSRRWPSAEEMRLALQRGVPQAFELGFDVQLRTFMADTVGEREARKREALHRAEVVVDAGANDSGSSSSSTSVTSLRAIAVDTSAEPAETLAPRPTGRLASLRPLLARSIPPAPLRRPLLIAATAAVALAFGVLWLRSPPDSSQQAAAAPNAGMVDLSPPRDSSAHPLPAGAASSASGLGVPATAGGRRSYVKAH